AGAVHVLPVVLIVDPAHTVFTLHTDVLLLRPRHRCFPPSTVPLARVVLTSLSRSPQCPRGPDIRSRPRPLPGHVQPRCPPPFSAHMLLLHRYAPGVAGAC